MIEITDIDDNRISHYRTLRFTPAQHTLEKVFISEGEKVTEKLFLSDLPVVSIFAIPEYFEKYSSFIDQKRIPENSKFMATKKLMEQIVGFHIHQGIMAIAKQPKNSNIDELSDRIVVLNGIVNAENVGSIVRNCAAFGIDSLIFDSKTGHPYLRRAVRVSIGNIFSMRVHEAENLKDILMNLKKEMNYSVISAEVADSAINIGNFQFPGKFALVFGSEGQGIDREILDISDSILKIPVKEAVASLNVSVSSAILLYEAEKKQSDSEKNINLQCSVSVLK